MAELCVHLVLLFNVLSINDQMQTEELAHHQNYQNGELVMDPTSSNNLVIVARGGAHLYTLDEDSCENITQILKMDDYADENWLFGEANMDTYAEATGNSDICSPNRNDFLALMKKKPELSIQFLEQNIIRVCAMHKQIQLLSLSKVEDRLLSHLQAYVKQVNKSSFALLLKTKDLALYSGATPETLSCRSALLEKQGSLRRKLRHIDLLQLLKIYELTGSWIF